VKVGTPQLPEIGASVGERVFEPTALQLFAFSASTWNGHRIHYDRDYAREQEGYPDILVQSHLHACFLAPSAARSRASAAPRAAPRSASRSRSETRRISSA